MPPASSSVTTASSMSSSSDISLPSSPSASSSDISLPSSPSPSPEHSPDPYAFSSLDEINDAPPANTRKPRRYVRTWKTADEVVLLEAVAAYKEQHGRLPKRADLRAHLPTALAGRLPHISAEKAANRLWDLRARYDGSVRRLRRGTVPVTDDDVRIFRLSKRIWEGEPRRQQWRRPRAAPHHERRAFAELEGMYPCLASEVEAIDARCGTPGLMRTAFERMGDAQAAELEAKVKRQRLAQLKADAKRAELSNTVLRTILDEME